MRAAAGLLDAADDGTGGGSKGNRGKNDKSGKNDKARCNVIL